MAIFLGVIAMYLSGCSSDTNQYSPDQVIHNALEEKTPAYYGETEMIITDKGEETREIVQEWRSNDGKTRTESQLQDGSSKVITVNDGSVMMVYEVEQNKAFMIDDVETLSLNQPSPRDQVTSLLEVIRDTHEVSTEDEGKILGRDVHRLIARAKQSDSLFGDLELWIDKEHWVVLKTVSYVGDIVSEMTYTKIDFNAKMSSDLFTVDLPEDVEVENLSSMLEALEISLEEIPTAMRESALYFPETDELKISLIELYEWEDKLDRNEININYTKDDLPLLSLSIFESSGETLSGIDGESVKIRNQEGFYIEMGNYLMWEEDGFTYSILFIDPNLTLEKFIEMAEEMEVIK